MEESRLEQPEPTAEAQAPKVGVVRQLLDVNCFWEPWWGWRQWLIQLGLFGVGSEIGGLIWRLIDADSASDRSFFERMLTNAYVWTCLIATALYALHDRRTRRQNTKTDWGS
jgi:hypothetical protein